MSQTMSIVNQERIKQLMNFGMGKNQLLNTLEYLSALAISLGIENISGNLTRKVMRLFSYDILPLVKPTGSITRGLSQ